MTKTLKKRVHHSGVRFSRPEPRNQRIHSPCLGWRTWFHLGEGRKKGSTRFRLTQKSAPALQAQGVKNIARSNRFGRFTPGEIPTISLDLHKRISQKRSCTKGNKNLTLLTSPIVVSHHVNSNFTQLQVTRTMIHGLFRRHKAFHFSCLLSLHGPEA